MGPFLGSLVAVGFYHFVKTLEYETANPGQDFNEHEHEAFEFDEENTARGADITRPGVNLTQNLDLKPTESIPMHNVSSNQAPISNVGSSSPVPSASSPMHNPNARPIPIQSKEPIHPSNPNKPPIRMDGSDGSGDSFKGGDVPYLHGPNAESGTLHPGFTKH